jgi:hypothetical protein
MRRGVSLAVVLVLSMAIAACTGMSDTSSDDQSGSDNSMQKSGHSGGGY